MKLLDVVNITQNCRNLTRPKCDETHFQNVCHNEEYDVQNVWEQMIKWIEAGRQT